MYKIKSICLLYHNNFNEQIVNIINFEPEIKIITNQSNEFNLEYLEYSDKYSLIEHCIKNYDNTLFLGSNYILKKKLSNFDTQKDLGLLKINNNYSLDCIYCENLNCIPYLKTNNLKNINFTFYFFVISKYFVQKQDITSLFIYLNYNVLRQSEYLTCINKNIDNPEINNIYYFSKDKIKESNIINKTLSYKLNFVEYKDTEISFKYISDYIKDNNIDGYKIISFPDIYFKNLNLNENLNLLMNKYEGKNIYISLSAYNVNYNFELNNNQHFENINNGLNHKALIFKNDIILEDNIIKLQDFNSINYVNYVINNNANNYIFNIPESIKIFHIDNLKKDRTKKNIPINKKYLFLPIYNKISFDYFSKSDKEDNYKNYYQICNFIGNYIKIIN